ARLLAVRLGLAYRLDGVRRVQDGRKQAALGRADRLQAQAGLYVCGRGGRGGARQFQWHRPDGEWTGRLDGLRIAVIDDVLTTGARLQAVSVALKAAGAVRVEGWVLARAVRRPLPR